MYRTKPGKTCAVALLSCGLFTLSSLDAQAGDWPQFHGDRILSGTVRSSTFKGSNANGLKIQWQANTGGAVWSSPVVKYHSKIKKTYVYAANSNTVLSAYDAATGDRVWYYKTGAAILSTPVIWGNAIWLGGQDRHLRKLDAITGALLCEYVSDGGITSAPVVADPDGAGPAPAMIYFGDAGLAGSDDGGNVTAVNVADCSRKWRFTGYGVPAGNATTAGTWAPIAFAPAWGKSRPPLIVFGGSSPDNAVYAINAITGNAARNVPFWRLQAAPNINDLDVGAGATVGHVTTATPGGVAFVSAKNSVMRAINLNTGEQIWQFDAVKDSPGNYHIRSTTAYAQRVLFFGYGGGLYALNAGNGTKRWKTTEFGLTMPDVISSPSVSFPADLGTNLDDAAIFFGDLGGTFHVVDGTGHQRWSYATGAPIFSSAAITDKQVFVGSSNGFLYAFGIGAGASAKPQTVIVDPQDNAVVPNPGNGANVTVSGTASDDASVARVLVAVKNNSTGKWWDAVTRTWIPIFSQSEATLDRVGGKNVNWQSTFPVTTPGGEMYVQADAVDSDRQHDPEVAQASFNVPPLGNPPTATFTYPAPGQAVKSYFPNGRQSYEITLTGTAEDTRGTNPGIKKVMIEIRNSDHNEYYCGPAGCPGLPAGTLWRPQWTTIEAVVANPGATSTPWSIVFPTYDHPHNYRFRVRPVDRDGNQSQGWIDGGKICVRDPGPVTDCYKL